MKIIYILLMFAVLGSLQAQDIIIQGNAMPANPNYSSKFTAFETYDIDVEETRAKFLNATRTGVEVDLILSGKVHRLQLYKYNIYTKSCVVRHSTAQGMVDKAPIATLETYRGYDANFGGQEAAITIAKNYMSLMFREGDDTYYLEQIPVEYNDSNPDHFILYNAKDVKYNKNVVCGADEVSKFKTDHSQAHEANKDRNRFCYEVDIALCCDFTYYKFYRRDPALAEARMTTVLNLVQTDWYGGRLLADYIYSISAVFVSEDSARDPWLGINDIFDQLTKFSQVGFNIFQGSFDVATNWTVKYTSGAVGVAYLPGTCVLTPFNICSEFTQDNGICRQLQSHELGHNWNCVHDAGGSPYIMAPVVNGSFQWSGASQWAISDWTFRIKACLGDCSGGDIPVAEFEADPDNGCIPLTVQFNNMSVNATNYKWKFPGGTPATSTLKNPVVTYNTLGAFNVELEVLNPKCTTSVEKLNYIVTNDKPSNVQIAWGNVNGYDAEFFGSGERCEESVWKFHDGTTEEGSYATKTYAKEGIYDVQYCCKNACGETCVKTKVGIYVYPVADFTSDTTAGCAPTTIKFFDQSSSNVIAWTWSFPGGTPTGAATKNPVVKYTRPGIYKVKLAVNSSKYSTSITKEQYIKIDSLPLPVFEPNINGASVTFDNLSLYEKSHFWDFGDGSTSTDSTPTHIFKDGRYEVKYIATNACGSSTLKKTITIGTKPIAGFSVASQKGCVPYTVQFQNTSTSTAKFFQWSFPGGNPSSSTDKEPFVTYNAVGKYDVKLVASSGPESDSITQAQYITVQEGPVSDFQNSVTGFVSYFTDLSKNVNTYYWDFGDGKSSTEKSPNHNYGVEGEFTVRLITENECGIDTLEKLIAVYLIPKVNFIADTIRGCAPFKVQFRDKSSVDVVEWNWQFESGLPVTSMQKNPVVSFEKAGKYTVKLTVRNGNGTNSATKLKYVEVISPVKCPKKPGKKTGAEANNPGFGIEDQIFSRSRTEYEVSIYPNPVNDELIIQAKAGTKYQLMTLTGQPMISGVVKSAHENLDVSRLATGTYFLKIDHEDLNEVVKVMINR
ncbi:MAG: PKD domain-containing protein [Saprospiraceae bacterium]